MIPTTLVFRNYRVLRIETHPVGSHNMARSMKGISRTLIFYMNDCRVQAARKRKGLSDYPCKSAGLVEYPYFAAAIDRRIRTECVGCPPDEHPDEWFCAWKFTLVEE